MNVISNTVANAMLRQKFVKNAKRTFLWIK